MQCYNTTIEWIDCEIRAGAKNRCAVYTCAIGTNTVFRLRICSLNTTVFIHLNPITKIPNCFATQESILRFVVFSLSDS